jgi:hypothetical protein
MEKEVEIMPCQKCTGNQMSYTEPQDLWKYTPSYDGQGYTPRPTGAIAPTTKYLVAGIVVGSLATMFFIHLTGATSVRGAAHASGRALKKMW